MQTHPTLNLLVHTTGELELVLGERIVAREQMHAWPLSSVEALTTAAGARFVYKVQREPTFALALDAESKLLQNQDAPAIMGICVLS